MNARFALARRAGLLGLAALTLSALQSPETPAPDAPSLAGQLLVAAPDMGDPRFDGTVILIVHHGANGAFGVVINRPAGEKPIATLLEEMGEDGGNASGSIPLFLGGPMEAQLGFVIHTADYMTVKTLPIGDKFAMTSDPDILRDIAAGKGPKRSFIAFGYAGWAPGQLEDELSRNSWYLAPADEALLFDKNRDTVWQRAYDRKTLRL